MAAGQQMTYQVAVRLDPNTAMQWVVLALSGVSSASAAMAGPNVVTVTRRYIPT